MGVLRDSDSRWYMREEAGGLILGPYEDGAPAKDWTRDRPKCRNGSINNSTTFRINAS